MQARPPSPIAAAGAGKRPAGRVRAGGTALMGLLLSLPVAAIAQTWTEAWPLDATPAATPATVATPAARPVAMRVPRKADFQHASAPAEVRFVADWVADSADNRGLPYMIIDKVNATVFVFDARGRLQGTGPALLGITPGDRTPEGIGDRKLSAIPVQDRITPAGRFVASLDRDLQGQSILWVDYASALALHRVVKGKPDERRAERLQSESSQDNRISFGCINVQANFFDSVVSPAFTGTNGIVYILPETGTVRDMFGAYDVNIPTGAHALPKP